MIISSYDRGSTFFYCDPPYYGLSDYTSQGSKPFSKEDHVRLKECLSKIQGRFLLSINDHPEIRKLYSGFNIKPVEVRYSVSSLAWWEPGFCYFRERLAALIPITSHLTVSFSHARLAVEVGFMFVSPMLLRKAEEPFDNDEWLSELKVSL